MRKPHPIQSDYLLDQFDCGNEDLNTYLKKFAIQNHGTGSARAHVIVDNNHVVGSYTLTSSSILKEDSPKEITRGLPAHRQVPAVLLGRFAVDIKYQGRGVGLALLDDALIRICHVAEDLGIRVVVVDAKDAAAKKFYTDRDFKEFEPGGMRLYLLIRHARRTYGLD